MDVGKPLTVLIAENKCHANVFDGPGRREAAGGNLSDFDLNQSAAKG